MNAPHASVSFRAALALSAVVWLTPGNSAGGQAAGAPRTGGWPFGWETSGLPAVNFDADEGFGYGFVLQSTDYGAPGTTPYRFSIQPTVLFTVRGRRDFKVNFDAPHLLPGNWRLNVYGSHDKQLATPYYGVGNATIADDALERSPNPYYYRFGRSGLRVNADLQHSLRGPLRVLVGAGLQTTAVTVVPFDSGTTLLASEKFGRIFPNGRNTHIRAGLVWDSRDREIGPTRGSWIEALVQHADPALGGSGRFTRSTLTARHYVTLRDRLIFAERVVVQNLAGDVPFYDMFAVQSSVQEYEGLGGSSSVRGLPKNRYAGKGLALSNSEIRYRVADFDIRSRPSSLVLNGFADAGRVWADRLRIGEIAQDLHAGAGLGARLAYGKSFVVAVDAGHSSQSRLALYIGLGYLF